MKLEPTSSEDHKVAVIAEAETSNLQDKLKIDITDEMIGSKRANYFYKI